MAYINGKENFVISVTDTEKNPTYNGEIAISGGEILGQNLKGKTVLFKFAPLDGVTLEDTQLLYIDENNKVEVNEIYDNYYYYDDVHFGGNSYCRDSTELESITYTFPDDIDAIVTKHNTEIVTVEIVEIIDKDDIVITLNSEQAVTLKCKGLKMESDVTVEVPEQAEKNILLENVPIALDFTNGDQIVSTPEGYAVKSAVITKPETLIPENIAEGVTIAGIEGIRPDDKTAMLEDVPIALDFTNGDQTVSVPEGYAVKSAVIAKPETLIPENIAAGVIIAGVEGSHVGGGGGSGEAVVWFVTFKGADGSELFKMPVLDKDDCKDPINHGDIETPTKESTVSQVFTYNGWALTADGTADSSALKNVTEDRTVYAAFAVSARKYTVKFYDGETLLSTQQVAYGVTPTVTTPKKDGYSFDSWQPTLGAVEGDTDYYAQWIEKVTFSGGTWEDIIRVAESGQASEHFKVGDTRTEQLNYEDGTSEIITLTVAGFDYDSIGSTSNKAGVSIISNVLATDRRMFASSISGVSDGYYNNSELRTYLNNTVKKALPSNLQAAVKQVKKAWKTSASGSNLQDEQTSNEYLWLIDNREIYTEAARYPIFTSDKNSRIAYKTDGTAANYWTRSGSGSSVGNWSYYNTLGNSSDQVVTKTCGVRFGFCI